jgi:hypothetical protein
MSENKESLLRRIRALAAKTTSNGCTESEAMSAAALLARLVDKYGLTPDDLAAPLERLTEEAVKQDMKMTCNSLYAVDVAKYCDCEAFRRKKLDKKHDLVFFGTEVDVLLAKYIMALLATANQSGFRDYILNRPFVISPGSSKVSMNRERRNFNIGFAERISTRLIQMKIERNTEVDQNSGLSNSSLVVVKNKLVTEEFARRYNINFTNRSVSYQINEHAYNAGNAHAANVAINAGVGDTPPRLRIK